MLAGFVVGCGPGVDELDSPAAGGASRPIPLRIEVVHPIWVHNHLRHREGHAARCPWATSAYLDEDEHDPDCQAPLTVTTFAAGRHRAPKTSRLPCSVLGLALQRDRSTLSYAIARDRRVEGIGLLLELRPGDAPREVFVPLSADAARDAEWIDLELFVAETRDEIMAVEVRQRRPSTALAVELDRPAAPVRRPTPGTLRNDSDAPVVVMLEHDNPIGGPHSRLLEPLEPGELRPGESLHVDDVTRIVHIETTRPPVAVDARAREPERPSFWRETTFFVALDHRSYHRSYRIGRDARRQTGLLRSPGANDQAGATREAIGR